MPESPSQRSTGGSSRRLGGVLPNVRLPAARPAALATVLLTASLGIACAGSHVRGSENPNLDEMTMSLRLDRKDIDRLYRENVDKLLASSVVSSWKHRTDGENPPAVAVFPIRNESSEHIRGTLDALASKLETTLVNQTPADVVALDRQKKLIQQVKRQQAGAFDPARIAEFGKQVGAQYYVTGKVYDVAERTEKKRRVQYFFFLQVVDVATGEIKFQTESSLTKGLIG
ncbi:MAG: penicillin-binding protein activator LpoB [Bradymonadaceae bacterium]